MANKHIYSINGLITSTVASNNLTVALKNYDDTDFSASVPLIDKIGNSPRALSGALSVTVNAGANIFNAGAAELLTKEIDYFVYLGWRAASSTVFILISRIPYATTYADFSATTTNEKYGAFSGSAPASTDAVTNIGRFNATNSGTASFNWSIPATAIVINHQIYKTRWLTWTPTITGYSANPTNANYRYQIDYNSITCFGSETGVGTSNAASKTYSMPFTTKTIANMQFGTPLPLPHNNGANEAAGIFLLTSNDSVISMFRSAAAAWTASGNCLAWQYGNVTYEI